MKRILNLPSYTCQLCNMYLYTSPQSQFLCLCRLHHGIREFMLVPTSFRYKFSCSDPLSTQNHHLYVPQCMLFLLTSSHHNSKHIHCFNWPSLHYNIFTAFLKKPKLVMSIPVSKCDFHMSTFSINIEKFLSSSSLELDAILSSSLPAYTLSSSVSTWSYFSPCYSSLSTYSYKFLSTFILNRGLSSSSLLNSSEWKSSSSIVSHISPFSWLSLCSKKSS